MMQETGNGRSHLMKLGRGGWVGGVNRSVKCQVSTKWHTDFKKLGKTGINFDACQKEESTTRRRWAVLIRQSTVRGGVNKDHWLKE